MTDQSRTYLDPLHDELDRLRTEVSHWRELADNRLMERQWAMRDHTRAQTALEQAEARVDQLTDQLTLANDTLRHRANAVNATGATNDTLRATIARVEKVANAMGDNLAHTGYARGQREACAAILAILDQEPAK